MSDSDQPDHLEVRERNNSFDLVSRSKKYNDGNGNYLFFVFLEGIRLRSDAERIAECWNGWNALQAENAHLRERNAAIEEIDQQYARVQLEMQNEINRLLEEAKEHEASFDLYHKAEMRAIEMWHAKGGDPKVWPDKAKMTVWLLEENARLRSLADELAAALRAVCRTEWPGGYDYYTSHRNWPSHSRQVRRAERSRLNVKIRTHTVSAIGHNSRRDKNSL